MYDVAAEEDVVEAGRRSSADRPDRCRRAHGAADRLTDPCRTSVAPERRDDQRGLVVEDDSVADDADVGVPDDAATCRPVVPVFPGEDEADNYHSRTLRLVDYLVELGVLHLEE